MAKVLGAVFEQLSESTRGLERLDKSKGGSKNSEMGEISSLKIITLGTIAQAIFLVGTKEEMRRAEEIIKRVESQVGEARERLHLLVYSSAFKS